VISSSLLLACKEGSRSVGHRPIAVCGGRVRERLWHPPFRTLCNAIGGGPDGNPAAAPEKKRCRMGGKLRRRPYLGSARHAYPARTRRSTIVSNLPSPNLAAISSRPTKRSRVQPLEAIGLKRSLPGLELLFRHLIVAARILKGDHAAGHCRHDRGFVTSPPPLDIWRRQPLRELVSIH
jgi:hypothetical protein